MPWEWHVLTGVVRILFLLAPFSVEKEFGYRGDNLLEVREFALAGNCRAMLVSFPAELLLAVLAEASIRCQAANLVTVAIYVVIGSLLAFGLYKIPVRYFRGAILPFIWLAGFTVLGIAAQIKALAPAVSLMCRP